MTKKFLATILILALVVVCGEPFSIHASQNPGRLSALAAYRDFLAAPQSIEASVEGSWIVPHLGRVPWSIQDVRYAELIDFDNNGIPELVLYISLSIPADRRAEINEFEFNLFHRRLVVVGYNAGRAEVIYEGIVWGEGGTWAGIGFADSSTGLSYLVHMEGGGFTTNRNFLALRNGRWESVLATRVLTRWDNAIQQNIPEYFYVNNARVNQAQFNQVTAGDLGITQTRYLEWDTTNDVQGLLAAINRELAGSTQPTGQNLDTASSWAREGIADAIASGLVPNSLQNRYTNNITRAEFAALSVALYESTTGRVITERQTFNDTADINVQKMGGLGVIMGVGGGNFAPNNTLTREQAATMLARLANVMGQPLPPSAPTFADNTAISSWAVSAVGQVQVTEIMSGVGNNNFSPLGSFTREQSILTVLRMHKFGNR